MLPNRDTPLAGAPKEKLMGAGRVLDAVVALEAIWLLEANENGGAGRTWLVDPDTPGAAGVEEADGVAEFPNEKGGLRLCQASAEAVVMSGAGKAPKFGRVVELTGWPRAALLNVAKLEEPALPAEASVSGRPWRSRAKRRISLAKAGGR